jgi:chloramphenicol 3-O phosphotransferase
VQRRRVTWGEGDTVDGSVPAPVRRWQEAVHIPGIYDLEVDTSRLSPVECANTLRQRLENGPPPSAFRRLAHFSTGADPVAQ